MGKVRRWALLLMLAATTAGMGALAAPPPAAGAPARQAARSGCVGAHLYPSPGTRTASTETQISLQGVAATRISAAGLTVVGSETGHHPGRLVADASQAGASFYPSQPFAAGERVTVTTPIGICGSGDSASFQVATAPAPLSGPTPTPTPTAPAPTQHFVTAPEITPPTLIVSRASAPASQGDILLTPDPATGEAGPMIVNGKGQLVWFDPLPQGELATDLREQTYRGQSVLTWFQGALVDGHGQGEFVVANHRYQVIRTVRAAEGYEADLHELVLGQGQTAWLAAYATVGWNLSAEGGPPDAAVYDCVVQELDLRTGNVLFEWHSLDHVAPGASYFPYLKSQTTPLDYFHLNSIEPLADGTVLLSARNTEAAYLVDEATGSIRWTLGGKHSSFALGVGAAFALQHDVELHGKDTVTLFDDEDTNGSGPAARAIELQLNFRQHTARLLWARQVPGYLLVLNQGNVQLLNGGYAMVGWGAGTYTTEYGPGGRVVFDAHFPGSTSSYRAYRAQWTGDPATAPAVASRGQGNGLTVYASWNGSTEVSSWRVLGGPNASQLAPLATAPWRGFQNSIHLSSRPAVVQVEALGRDGTVLARSALLPTVVPGG